MGIRVQQFHSPKQDRFAFSQFAHKNLNSKRISTDIPSVDKMIRTKCDLVYDKYMNSHQLMFTVREKSSNENSLQMFRKFSAPSLFSVTTSKSNKTDFDNY